MEPWMEPKLDEWGFSPFQTPSRAKTQPYQPATMPDAFDEFTAALDDWFQHGQNVVPIIIVTGLATMFAVSWLVRCSSLPCSLMRQQPDLPSPRSLRTPCLWYVFHPSSLEYQC